VKIFSHLIYLIKKFYKVCTFNTICKYDAAINCITVQHKKLSSPSPLTGHTLLNNNNNKGIETKGLKNYLETIPGKHSIDSLQKTAALGTSHIIRKVLQSET
jgi:hypothetical protein